MMCLTHLPPGDYTSNFVLQNLEKGTLAFQKWDWNDGIDFGYQFLVQMCANDFSSLSMMSIGEGHVGSYLSHQKWTSLSSVSRVRPLYRFNGFGLDPSMKATTLVVFDINERQITLNDYEMYLQLRQLIMNQSISFPSTILQDPIYQRQIGVFWEGFSCLSSSTFQFKIEKSSSVILNFENNATLDISMDNFFNIFEKDGDLHLCFLLVFDSWAKNPIFGEPIFRQKVALLDSMDFSISFTDNALNSLCISREGQPALTQEFVMESYVDLQAISQFRVLILIVICFITTSPIIYPRLLKSKLLARPFQAKMKSPSMKIHSVND